MVLFLSSLWAELADKGGCLLNGLKSEGLIQKCGPSVGEGELLIQTKGESQCSTYNCRTDEGNSAFVRFEQNFRSYRVQRGFFLYQHWNDRRIFHSGWIKLLIGNILFNSRNAAATTYPIGEGKNCSKNVELTIHIASFLPLNTVKNIIELGS